MECALKFFSTLANLKGIYSMKTNAKKIVMAALIAALACVATMIIKIPSPLNGYVNLGDCVVLVAGWMLSPTYGFLAAGIGSAMADLFSGYVVYVPATFAIKGLMALIAYFVAKALQRKQKKFTAKIVSGIAAEIFMVVGYFVFEGFLYGFIPSAVNIPANAVQGFAGIIMGILLASVFEKSKISFE